MGAQTSNSTSTACKRLDGLNLAKKWQQMREIDGVSHAYVTNTQEMENIDLSNTEHIMGEKNSLASF